MSKLVAFDVGTSQLKVALYDRERGIVASASVDYEIEPFPHRQNADVWWTAARSALQKIETDNIEAIVMSGTMENLILRDKEGIPLHSIVLYSNRCGEPYHAAMQSDLVNAQQIIGNRHEPLMTGFKWCWFSDIAPTIVPRVGMVMAGAKDDLLYRMTGRAATDAVTGSTTGFMDIGRRDWSDEMLSLFRLKREILPEILEPGALVGALRPEAARHLGLRAGIPVMNGCGDAGASTIGSFCDAPNDSSLHLGSSGWLARTAPIKDLIQDRAGYRLAHPWRDLIIEISPMQNVGIALSWVQSTLGLKLDESESPLKQIDAMPPNLVFLPYLSGERAPFDDVDVRGAFLGLDASHTKGDMLYAALEGMAFLVAANLSTLNSGIEGTVTMIGEGAKGRVWPQILADVLDWPVNLTSDPTLSSIIGVCRVATAVLGWPAPETFERERIMPRPDRMARVDLLGEAFFRATDVARAFSPFLTL